MSETIVSCCTPPERAQEEKACDQVACPGCGHPGKRLDEFTVQALLKPAALERRSENHHPFCPSADCPVVYFGRKETFGTGDVAVPVFPKAREAGTPVCYCFGIAVGDIEREIARTGRSGAEERIRNLVRLGRCACELRNPQGSCCLGNVGRVIREARRAVATSAQGSRA